MNIKQWLAISILTTSLTISGQVLAEKTILNVSYDTTRELYQEFNAAFAKFWQSKNNEAVKVQQSHGGSGKQARSVIDGLEADVVTLALASDINAIAEKAKLLSEDWQQRLARNSTPYTSTIIFLVRKGNPKGIKDWEDLTHSEITVITPNPKTSGGAQWNYLTAWEYGKRRFGGDDQAKEFVTSLYKNVPVLDSGARGSTATFAERGVGDVLIAWENEAFLALKEYGTEKFEIVIPSLSILTEPSVAVVDTVVDKHGTRQIAEAYLQYLYSDEGQEIAAKHFFRPTNEKIAAKYADQFPKLELFRINDAFGGWKNAYKAHFIDGGHFDQIYLH
ncbi:sulfate ABC transporter substrate-binding protein [Nitrosomonas sp.]|uniref:sulfate ABC transporter substrate-binding protein n=1 Tax=Nitrosomonas sp. TaxID=42353 RepID=UPI001D9ED084|nr:sulfate ABC transporter substrate-binding protein [Nitrosomonas sp.]MBX3617295.1 sulfate ABC transporter substrate-binding protein [Nitrosomonas sp.]